MATDVTMPRLSDSMEEGTVLKWLVEEGGEVKRGEPLVEIETDKANMTYEADTDGALIEIVAQEGDTLAIGETIARIGDPSEAGGNGKAVKKEEAKEEEPSADEAEADESEGEPAESEDTEEAEEREPVGAEASGDAEAAGRAGRRRYRGGRRHGDQGARTERQRGPRRRRHRSRGAWRASWASSWRALEGIGPGRADREGGRAGRRRGRRTATAAPATEAAAGQARASARPEPQRGEAGAKGETEIQELTRLQQTVSRRMAESKATAPDFSISLTVDMTDAVELRKRLKEVADPAPSFNDMVVKASATALREHPRVNGAYRDGKFELYERVNIGVAVAAAGRAGGAHGLRRRPQVARRRSPATPAPWPRRCATRRSRRPSCRAPRSRCPTSACSGSSCFTAIINPPQAAILTVGALAKRPAVDDTGRIVARDQMHAVARLRPPHPLRCRRRAVPGARQGAARAAPRAGALEHFATTLEGYGSSQIARPRDARHARRGDHRRAGAGGHLHAHGRGAASSASSASCEWASSALAHVGPAASFFGSARTPRGRPGVRARARRPRSWSARPGWRSSPAAARASMEAANRGAQDAERALDRPEHRAAVRAGHSTRTATSAWSSTTSSRARSCSSATRAASSPSRAASARSTRPSRRSR